MRRALLVLLLAGCSDEPAPDLGAPLDLLGPDLPVELPDLEACTPPVFAGFDTSATEQRFECTTCGCLVDSLDGAATSPWWTRDLVSATVGDGDGVQLAGTGEATLRSTFYLDGDFDLRVDAQIDSGQATLSVLEGQVVSAVSTTLRLVRQGTTLTAYANGAMQTSTASPARMPIELVGHALPCDQSGCLDLTLAHLRLATGALVDRAP